MKCFEGSAFAAYCEGENRKKEEERRRQQKEKERQKQLKERGREEAESYERGKRHLEPLSAALRENQGIVARYPNVLRSAAKND